LNSERISKFPRLLLDQLGYMAKGHYPQFRSKHLQHICALAMGVVHDLCGLGYHTSGIDKRPMVPHGFGQMD
jgi:hypothetical protein